MSEQAEHQIRQLVLRQAIPLINQSSPKFRNRHRPYSPVHLYKACLEIVVPVAADGYNKPNLALCLLLFAIIAKYRFVLWYCNVGTTSSEASTYASTSLEPLPMTQYVQFQAHRMLLSACCQIPNPYYSEA
ncbi:hypothetical protein TNCV_143051 [Trichonephila clavipes]|nr:hypothetical protein TNCV_143051 [Trichonephila clavipes]